MIYSVIYNEKSKHINLRHSDAKQLLQDGEVNIIYIKSKVNLAYPFTRALAREDTLRFSNGMGLKPL